MGKSTSSFKKKRSKVSSQARFKKRSKSRTRRNKKSKKLCYRDDSVSYSSDGDDSRSSVSVSSSSSEDDYRRKRSRSRMQKDVKGSKKRACRQSSGHESIEDSPRVTRRKGSKKNDDIQVRKKNREKKKKKTKRDVSVSSTSSESWSCSTCRGGISSSDESEVEKIRGRSERKDKDRRRLEKVKNGHKWGRSILRSCSSCSGRSEYSDCRSEDNLTGEANSRRLRSVIIVAREGTGEEGMGNDEHEEEMVHDHGGYPSSRSNDSTDGGSRRELLHNSHVSPKKWHAEDEKGEAVVLNIGTSKVTESDKDNTRKAGSNPSCDGVGMNDDVKEKKNEVLGATGGMNSHDLETILRQKALENLRIFQSGNQTDAKVPINQKDLIGGDAKMSPTIKSQSSQNRSPVGVGVRVVSPSQVAKGKNILVDLSHNDKKVFNRNDSGKEISSTKHNVAYPPDRLPLTGYLNETVTFESNQSRSVVLASKQESFSTCTTKMQLPASQEPPQAKSTIRNSDNMSMVETDQTLNPLSGNGNFDKANKASTLDDLSSFKKSSSAGTSSNKPQDEANEGSQFQQKTMTVMRGGEMVEVSYKVYIPKKATALAWRPLKR